MAGLAGLAVVVAVAAAGAAGPEECLRDRITVEGQAEVRVKPDRVRIAFAAEQRGPTVAQAEAGVKASTDVVLRAARDHGVSDSDIDKSDYSIEPMYESTEGRRLGKRLGFQVRRSLQVTLRDLSKLDSLQAQAMEDGNVTIGGIEPESEKTRGQRDSARLMAVRAAREKAQAIVSELGRSLGRALSVEVDGASPCCGWQGPDRSSIYNYGANSSSSDTEPGYALGVITLTARVKVTFELK